MLDSNYSENITLLRSCNLGVASLSINIWLERQEKLGVSDWVGVPDEKV